MLVWYDSLTIHLVYLFNTQSHFWHPWVGSTLQQSPNIEEENPRSGLAVGAVAESQPSLKLPSLVVPAGK